LARSYLENTYHKKDWWSGSRCRPWVQAPVLPKKKKILINTIQEIQRILSRWESKQNPQNPWAIKWWQEKLGTLEVLGFKGSYGTWAAEPLGHSNLTAIPLEEYGCWRVECRGERQTLSPLTNLFSQPHHFHLSPWLHPSPGNSL
jgi:hypothetical protein